MTKLKASSVAWSAMTALGVGVVLAGGINPAVAYADEACARVCITDLHTNGSNLYVAWAGNEPFAHYQVYWERTGTLEIRSQRVAADQRAFDIPDVQPGSTYRIQVMGCSATTPWYAAGPCGAVDQRDFTT
jgi:Fibronectin type III domain